MLCFFLVAIPIECSWQTWNDCDCKEEITCDYQLPTYGNAYNESNCYHNIGRRRFSFLNACVSLFTFNVFIINMDQVFFDADS